jgi:hypothetical protein
MGGELYRYGIVNHLIAIWDAVVDEFEIIGEVCIRLEFLGIVQLFLEFFC